MKKTEITMEQVSELLKAYPPARQDPRLRVVTDLVHAYEEYTQKLEWLARSIEDVRRKNEEYGIRGVHETVLQTSLIPDITGLAAKINALVRVLELTSLAEDDPASTPVDALIRTLDWRP